MAFTLSSDREQVAESLIARYPEPRAACIPLLHLCQKQDGWVSPEIIQYVADRLGMTTAQVKGVVTFYTSFHQHEPAPNVVWVCRTLSCELRGAKVIQSHLEKRFGCTTGHNSKDGKFMLKKAECLAACGQGPMVQINDDYHENLTLEKLDALLDGLARNTAAPEPLNKASESDEPTEIASRAELEREGMSGAPGAGSLPAED